MKKITVALLSGFLILSPASAISHAQDTEVQSIIDQPVSTLSHHDMLNELPMSNTGASTAYDRELFSGGKWADPDGNGCDTRNDILARDLTNTTVDSDDCKILTGTLLDPYTGQTIQFQRGQDTSSAVQIDHIVAASNAWQNGADTWEQAKRDAFYNDPLNLLAVDGPENGTKSDKDASEWLPPNRNYVREFIERQIEVKHKYGLSVTEAEAEVMYEILGDEAATPTTDPGTPETSPTPTRVNTPQPPAQSSDSDHMSVTVSIAEDGTYHTYVNGVNTETGDRLTDSPQPRDTDSPRNTGTGDGTGDTTEEAGQATKESGLKFDTGGTVDTPSLWDKVVSFIK